MFRYGISGCVPVLDIRFVSISGNFQRGIWLTKIQATQNAAEELFVV